jgi:tripartite-type tricarboxylate transporter receptor subunit TctC
MFLFANPALQAQNVKDLIALAKSQPGKLAIASGGTGATTHLTAELFQSHAGIRLTHVPYKGAGPAITDVVAGQIPLTFTSMATAAPFVKAGRLRATYANASLPLLSSLAPIRRSSFVPCSNQTLRAGRQW